MKIEAVKMNEILNNDNDIYQTVMVISNRARQVIDKRFLEQINLGKPLTSIPDPFEKYESFGHHNNAKLRSFLDEFKFEYEFVSSWDGCYDDYSLKYDDGSNVEEELEEEIMSIIEEEGIDELEDNYDFLMIDTTYEIDGELDIQKIN